MNIIPFDLAQITSNVNRTRAESGLPASTLNQSGLMHVAVFGGNSGERAVASALTAHAGGRYDFESENFVCGAQSAAQGGPDDNSAQARHVIAVKGAAIGRAPENGPQYSEVLDDGTCYTLNCTEVHAVLPSVGTTLGKESYSPSKSSSGQMVDFAIPSAFGVRRLTPVECERLQGFDDGWTAWGVDENGQRIEMSDSVRYRALGNAVNRKVVEWLDRRIVQYS